MPHYCSAALSVNLIDIDNDGKEELLVKCKIVGVYLLYVRGSSKTDWTLDDDCNGKGSLGDISNQLNELPEEEEMREFCEKYSSDEWWTKKNKICDNYNRYRSLGTDAETISIVDLDNNGFLDIVSTSNFGHLRFYIHNPSIQARKNKFIGFRLIGDVAGSGNNYYGIGATLILHAQEINTKKMLKQFREVSSSQHHTDFA